MALVRLRGQLKRLAGDRAEHSIEGATVAELLAEFEREHPAASGWILDERGALRRHINVFVNGELGGMDTAFQVEDKIDVLPAISGGSNDDDRAARRDEEGPVRARGRAGRAVRRDRARVRRRAGRVRVPRPALGTVARLGHLPFYGPKIMYTDDPTGEWEQADGVALPAGGEEALERIWVITAGERTAPCTPAAIPACCSRAVTAVPASSSTAGSGSTRRGRAGSRAPAASACTRSCPGPASPTGSPWRSRRPGCG